MSIYLADVAYWVEDWDATGELISEAVARTIAAYWAACGEDGVLAAFARGETPDDESFRDELEGTIRYAKSAGIFGTTIRELYALKAWAEIGA